MYEAAHTEEMDRLERVVNRVFARVSALEARVNELERELERSRPSSREFVRVADGLRLVDALGRTA
ncbi:MAG TPA: hypothetical protein PLF26_07885 [Blastocatellia bacterium]|nr:hypothetical protein [Blastocatellia bacterium]